MLSDVDACHRMGLVHLQEGRLEAAMASLARALALAPARSDLHAALGRAFYAGKRFAEAAICFRRALARRADDPETLTNLGRALREDGNFDEAVGWHVRALALRPDFIEARAHLTFTLYAACRLDEAIAAATSLLARVPGHPVATFCLAFALLKSGDLPAGSAVYEARFGPAGKFFAPQAKSPPRPLWDGRALPGGTLVLWHEQGFGDTIQFVRYAKLVRPLIGRLILYCPPALIHLMTTAGDIDEIVSDTAPLPPADFYVPIMSLMRAQKTTLATIPVPIPYLHADPARIKALSPLLASPLLKVGLVWAGNQSYLGDHRRSTPLSALAPLLAVEGVRFFSLQLGGASAEQRQGEWSGRITDLAPHLKDFADTAAALTGLDLLITVDTAVLHLAGALGRPAWAMIPGNGDWRWGLSGTTTPWYPGVTLYRQDRIYDWHEVARR